MNRCAARAVRSLVLHKGSALGREVCFVWKLLPHTRPPKENCPPKKNSAQRKFRHPFRTRLSFRRNISLTTVFRQKKRPSRKRVWPGLVQKGTIDSGFGFCFCSSTSVQQRGGTKTPSRGVETLPVSCYLVCFCLLYICPPLFLCTRKLHKISPPQNKTTTTTSKRSVIYRKPGWVVVLHKLVPTMPHL